MIKLSILVMLGMHLVFPLSYSYSHDIPLIKSAVEKKKNGIARIGFPKYAPDFAHFDYVNPDAPKGGRMRLGATGTFDTLNPFIARGIAELNLVVCFDPLMKRSADEPFTLYPLIAEHADISDDLKTVTIYLNPKARFHDGSRITTNDIEFTIEKLKSEGLPRYRQFYSKIKSIEKVAADPDRIIKIILSESDPELPYILLLMKPLSKKSLEHTDLRMTGLNPLLGSGPYKITKEKAHPGRSITYERVKDYWAADLPVNKGQYNFDEIVINYYKSVATLLEAFKAKEFDVLFEADPKTWMSSYRFPAVEQGRVKQVNFEHRRPVSARTLIFNMRKGLFADIRVRKALSDAFDWDTLNRMLYHGCFKRMTSLFANTYLAHSGSASPKEMALLGRHGAKLPAFACENTFQASITQSVADHRANLEKASKTLEEAGWVIENGKRVHRETKEPLRFSFMIKDPLLEKLVLSYKESLKKIGVDLSVQTIDNVQYEERVIQRDFDMIIHTWSNSLAPGAEQVYYFSQKMADEPGSSNYIGIKDPILEALAEEVPKAKTKEDLIAAVRALDRAVMNSHYFIPLYYNNTLYWAYWVDRIAFPSLNPDAGTNAIEWWYAGPEQLGGVSSKSK